MSRFICHEDVMRDPIIGPICRKLYVITSGIMPGHAVSALLETLVYIMQSRLPPSYADDPEFKKLVVESLRACADDIEAS